MDSGWVPSHNDEYLFYQTLVGVWPAEELDVAGRTALRERLSAYMLKAIREAKVHTSWINPNQEYEEGVTGFVQALLDAPERNLFLDDFLPFQRQIAHWGRLNSLSQTLLKLSSPGVPDIYQGMELLDLSLVDPDNRRPVDHNLRRKLLQDLQSLPANGQSRAAQARALLDNLEDGKAKLYVTWKALSLRREHPEWFTEGDYLALHADGPRADHLCAFARIYRDHIAVIATPRWFSRLASENGSFPLGPELWGETWVEAPPGSATREYINVFTDERVRPVMRQGKPYFPAHALFTSFPVTMLYV